MKELELKYGCNPNQKPSRIFMNDGRELPIDCFKRTVRDISTFWMLSTAGSWLSELKESNGTSCGNFF